jgi:putative transposase
MEIERREKESGDGSPHSKVVARLAALNTLQRDEVERLIAKFEALNSRKRGGATTASTTARDWPHAPVHRLSGKGTFIVTAGTLGKAHYFRDAAALDVLETELLSKARQYGWQLEAWAVFSNHYHFVGHALDDAGSLKPFLSHLHAETARTVNARDRQPGRQVWFNYWDTELTYEKSYLARLNYVHQNAVRHGLVAVANQYRWCSAGWFERTASPAQVKTIYSFKIDRLRVVDDFEVLGVL